MRPTSFAAILTLLLSTVAVSAQQTKVSPNPIYVVFWGFDEATNPKTSRKEFVFTVGVDGLAPKAEMKKLRRGDEFAGYVVGEFINRTPVWLPSDGYKPGTLPTLELVRTKTGEKIILEQERLWALPRDK